MPDTNESAMGGIPIKKTRRKLCEAQFFLERLKAESQLPVRTEPEVFGYYLNAFLSAARSVTFVLRCEAKDKYHALWDRWVGDQTAEDRDLAQN